MEVAPISYGMAVRRDSNQTFRQLARWACTWKWDGPNNSEQVWLVFAVFVCYLVIKQDEEANWQNTILMLVLADNSWLDNTMFICKLCSGHQTGPSLFDPSDPSYNHSWLSLSLLFFFTLDPLVSFCTVTLIGRYS